MKFFVNSSYSKNGMHQQSLKVENERKAKSLALQIYNSFNFAKYETSIIEEVKFDDGGAIVNATIHLDKIRDHVYEYEGNK